MSTLAHIRQCSGAIPIRRRAIAIPGSYLSIWMMQLLVPSFTAQLISQHDIWNFIWLHIGLHFHEKKKKKRKGLNHNQCISPHPPCSIYNVIYIKQTKKMMMTTKLNKCSARRCHPSYWKILIDVKGDQFDTHFWFYSSYLSVFFYLIYYFFYFFKDTCRKSARLMLPDKWEMPAG